MDMDTRLLRHFTAVAREGDLARAARRLCLSQPALTRQLRQLETRLGTELFTRTPAGLALTDAGTALAAAAPAVLDAWGAALSATRGAAARAERVLRVGFVAGAVDGGCALARRIVAEFTRRRPGWRVRLAQAAADDPTAGLAAGTADAALLRLPFPGQDRLDVRVLVTEERWVALPAAHRLAARAEVDFADLLDEPFVAGPPEPALWRDYWLAADERDGRPAKIGAVAHDARAWLRAVAEGHGVGLTLPSAARSCPRADVVHRPVRGVSPSVVGVACTRGAQVPPVVRDFVQACVTARDEPHARA
ncbi:LysR family transcriptional regulator [Streptomyces silvensis]|uniref:LysR family transcriptional regulator n=1 Tax=Streptomyces silvensis TaxID=1765722 RepID=A0A0W7X2Z8_9ACTN|nr:LysR family transcriptional regulator [Streptomyces silvensis]KUF17228.1 LysR family transcriptional regulator [Streptomyces silvensis]